VSVSVAASDAPAASITLFAAAVAPRRLKARSLVFAVEPMNRRVPPPEPLKPKKTLFCDTLA